MLAMLSATNFVFAVMAAAAQSAAPPPTAGIAGDAPLIDAVHFSGNTKLSGATLAQAIALRAGEPISKEKVKAALDRIVASYRADGYNLSISPDISHPAAGHVIVTFKIDESGTAGDSGPAPGAGGPAPGVPARR